MGAIDEKGRVAMKKVLVGRMRYSAKVQAMRIRALQAENQRLKKELETEKEYSRNYWLCLVWERTPDDMKIHADPCPVCGSLDVGLDGSSCCREFFVWCNSCGAMGPSGSGLSAEYDAIKAWNEGQIVCDTVDEKG